VERRAVENGQFGVVTQKVQGLADGYNRAMEKQVFEAMILGAGSTYGTAYDGAVFYHTSSHLLGANIIDNIDASSAGLGAADLSLCIQKMTSYKGDKDTPLGVIPTHLLCGPKLLQTAIELLSEHPASTSGYGFQGLLKLVVSPWCVLDATGTNTTSWVCADLSKRMKPVIVQQKGGVEFRMLGPESEMGFLTDMYTFGIRAEYVVGYGPPWLAMINTHA
jgi:phage major head subunit gpT-like protein